MGAREPARTTARFVRLPGAVDRLLDDPVAPQNESDPAGGWPRTTLSHQTLWRSRRGARSCRVSSPTSARPVERRRGHWML